MLKIKGVNVWPATFDRAIFAVEGVTDYRGTVQTLADGGEQIAIRAEGSGDPPELVEAISASIRRLTGLSALVALVPAGTLAREVPEGVVKVNRIHDQREIRQP
jgi:phenylacetate-coenzyme A ligase PaaK-like adenylate-forming protein